MVVVHSENYRGFVSHLAIILLDAMPTKMGLSECHVTFIEIENARDVSVYVCNAHHR